MAKKPTYKIKEFSPHTGKVEQEAVRIYRVKKQPKDALYEQFEIAYPAPDKNNNITGREIKRNKVDGELIYGEHFTIAKVWFDLHGVYINEATAKGLFPGMF